MKNLKLKNEKGITLIALIVTIIVLLILAVIDLNEVFRKDGVIGKTEQAREERQIGELLELVEQKIADLERDKYSNTLKYEGMEGYLKELEQSGVTVKNLAEGTWDVSKNGQTITVYENGDIVKGGIIIWDGSTRESPEFKEGNWYIYNAKQLKFLADYVNEELTEIEKVGVPEITSSTVVYLMKDIDLGARPEVDGSWSENINRQWTPIGSKTENNEDKYYKFTGTFEGNGNTIRGAYVSETANSKGISFAGIFGNTNNTIQNLTVKDSYIEATKTIIGGIVGALRGGEIINCHNINTEVKGIGTELYSIGGIVGQSQSNIKKCTNSGKIECRGSSESDNISATGGIVGLSATGSIEDCVNTGNVEGIGKGVGGIVGQVNSTNKRKNNKL